MSSPSPIVNFAIRAFQVVFAAVVLGLSVSLVRGQGPGLNSPISLRYCSFVGGLSFFAAIIGIAGEWVSALQGKTILLIDALVTLVNVAGGVVCALTLEKRMMLTKGRIVTCYSDWGCQLWRQERREQVPQLVEEPSLQWRL